MNNRTDQIVTMEYLLMAEQELLDEHAKAINEAAHDTVLSDHKETYMPDDIDWPAHVDHTSVHNIMEHTNGNW